MPKAMLLAVIIMTMIVLVLSLLILMFAGVLFASRHNFYLVLVDLNIRDEGCLRQSDLQVVF